MIKKIYDQIGFLLLLFLASITLSGCACPKNPAPFSSDRPGQTTTPGIVPPCYPQVELGWTHTEDKDASGTRTKNDQFPNTLLRFGVIPNAEVRVGYVGYNWQNTTPPKGSGTRSSGSGDANLGVKYRFLEASGWLPESAFLAQLSLPVGAKDFSSDKADPSFLFAFTNPINDFLSFSYNLGAAWQTGQDSDTNQNHTLSNFNYTASLWFTLTEHLGAFVEAYGSIAMNPSNSPSNALDGGFTYLILENFQVDISGGKGISEAATDWYVGAGFTYRYPQ
jgi:Putative MetA-pathway of phenol degradation